jgi:hypothetical protein
MMNASKSAVSASAINTARSMTYWRITLSLLLTLAVASSFTLRSFAARPAVAQPVVESPAGHTEVTAPFGVLVGRGSIMVNDNRARSGDTVVEGSTIVTGPDAYGWIDAGAAGRVELYPNMTTTLMLPRVETKVQAGQTKRTIKPVGSGPNISVKAGNALQLQVQVTDENDKPVRDEVVTFTLDNPAGGTLSTATVATDANGIATTTFTAGPTGSTGITASVPGATFTYKATIRAGLALLTLLLIGTAVVGTIVTIVVVKNSGDENPVSGSRP